MSTTHQEWINDPSTEKVTLAWIEPKERLLLWTLDTGAIYKRTPDFFIIDILEDTTSLTQASSKVLSAGEWFFDIKDGIVYVRMSDDSNPQTRNIIGTYRLFFSNAPYTLPYDLESGEDVEYIGSLESNSFTVQELDEEQIGIALESSTSISLKNNDGFFDEIYDRFFLENKNVELYSWGPDIPLSEKKRVFKGQLEHKNYSPKNTSFPCKDFMFNLRQPLNMDLFETTDGNLAESILGTPKRRIYGQVKNVRAVPVDNVLDGFELTGTISADLETSALVGVGTKFLEECSPEDTLTYQTFEGPVTVSIQDVIDDLNLTISESLEDSFVDITLLNNPFRPNRFKNRNWHIAGHKLREPVTTVATGSQPNRFILTDGVDIFDNDLIDFNGVEDVFIKQIVGNNVVIESNLAAGTPSGGETVTKSPISAVFFGSTELFINRDWTLSNTTEAILTLNSLAEFNVAKSRTAEGVYTFTAGSRIVTATGTELTTQLQSKDWIKSSDLTHAVFYEALKIEEGVITLRIPYAGSNTSGDAKKKNVVLIGDDGLITLNTIGMEASGAWVKTGSDVVNNLVSVDAGLTNINATSFTEADIDAPFTTSLVIPAKIGGPIPSIRDTVSLINETIFGSLVIDSNQDLIYNVFSPDRPTDLDVIEQDDIIGDFSVSSKNEIVREVKIRYSPFVDVFKDEDTFEDISVESSFVDNLIGSTRVLEKDIFLFFQKDAQTIAERYLFFNSLSQSVVTVKSKLNLSTKVLNEKIYIAFDRLYKRFGGRDRLKIGIINRISFDGANTRIDFNDLGNIFNRTGAIAPDDANDFTSATADEKIRNAYIVDDDLEIPDITSEQEFGQNLIG